MEKQEDSLTYDKSIIQRLNSLNIGSSEDLTEKVKEYLIRIEKIIQERKQRREELLKEYKALKISIKGITDECNISRQTIYNNKEILQTYINNALQEQEKEDIFYSINSLREQIESLEQKIFKMRVRDLDIEKQQYLIDEQNNILKNKDSTIEALEKRNMELIGKVNELEKKIYNLSIPLKLKK